MFGAIGLASLMAGIALWPAGQSVARPSSPPRASDAPAAAPATAPSGAVALLPLAGSVERTLALPAGVTEADLSAIPDRYLNDPPAARLRMPVLVRGVPGIASADAPAEVAWSEGGHWYWLRAKDLTLRQLIELAAGLR